MWKKRNAYGILLEGLMGEDCLEYLGLVGTVVLKCA
jgi:hypothetical protein